MLEKKRIKEILETIFESRFNVEVVGWKVKIRSEKIKAPELWDLIYREKIFGEKVGGWMSCFREENYVEICLPEMEDVDLEEWR